MPPNDTAIVIRTIPVSLIPGNRMRQNNEEIRQSGIILKRVKLTLSEEGDDTDESTQLEEYFYQALEVDLLLRLCPDEENTIYQIVDLLVDPARIGKSDLH